MSLTFSNSKFFRLHNYGSYRTYSMASLIFMRTDKLARLAKII